MTRAARYAYVVLAGAFLIGFVVQVFFIGLALFAGEENMRLHIDFGWILHLAPLLVLLAAVLSRAGRSHWLWALALTVAVFVVPLLPALRDSSPVAAALHPVVAIMAFWLAAVVARNSLTALRQTDASAAEPPREAASA